MKRSVLKKNVVFVALVLLVGMLIWTHTESVPEDGIGLGNFVPPGPTCGTVAAIDMENELLTIVDASGWAIENENDIDGRVVFSFDPSQRDWISGQLEVGDRVSIDHWDYPGVVSDSGQLECLRIRLEE